MRKCLKRIGNGRERCVKDDKEDGRERRFRVHIKANECLRKEREREKTH